MAKNTATKPQKRKVEVISPESLAGKALPPELARSRKIMVRHNLREEVAWLRCAKAKPLAAFVRDIVNAFVKTCGAQEA